MECYVYKTFLTIRNEWDMEMIKSVLLSIFSIKFCLGCLKGTPE